MLQAYQRVKRRMRRRSAQTAILYVVLLGCIILFIMVVVPYGQWGQVRVSTANSADAGCLAGMSWLASGVQECAWMVRRTHTAMAVMQALYLTPFCPEARQFADELWTYFTTDRFNGLPSGPGIYFNEACNTLMEEAWRLGAVATVTASFNNWIHRGGNAGLVTARQYGIYYSPGTVNAGFTDSWGSPDRQHTVVETISGYPAAPPTLNATSFDIYYYAWSPEPGWFSSPFRCGNGWGVTTPLPPHAQLTLTSGGDPWVLNPIQVIGGHNVKRYEEIDMTNSMVFPNVLVKGACASPVCGLEMVNKSFMLRPTGITWPAAPQVSVSVQHTVSGGGNVGAFSLPLFYDVTSGCTGEVNGSSPPLDPWTWPQQGTEPRITGTS